MELFQWPFMCLIPVFSEPFEVMKILGKPKREEKLDIKQNPNYEGSAIEVLVKRDDSNFLVYLDFMNIYNPS